VENARSGHTIIVMGVAGTGKSTLKSTLSSALAQRMGAQFLDTDDFHLLRKVEKTRAGEPLSDVDRALWLDVFNQMLRNVRMHGK
jgi:carbohydrate kinase (thermoresistant glucokinase family)